MGLATLVRTLCFLAMATSCGSYVPPQPCSQDYECGSNRTCIDGLCQPSYDEEPVAPNWDMDGDGFERPPEGRDCHDGMAGINPEAYDTLDEDLNCNGVVQDLGDRMVIAFHHAGVRLFNPFNGDTRYVLETEVLNNTGMMWDHRQFFHTQVDNNLDIAHVSIYNLDGSFDREIQLPSNGLVQSSSENRFAGLYNCGLCGFPDVTNPAIAFKVGLFDGSGNLVEIIRPDIPLSDFVNDAYGDWILGNSEDYVFLYHIPTQKSKVIDESLLGSMRWFRDVVIDNMMLSRTEDKVYLPVVTPEGTDAVYAFELRVDTEIRMNPVPLALFESTRWRDDYGDLVRGTYLHNGNERVMLFSDPNFYLGDRNPVSVYSDGTSLAKHRLHNVYSLFSRMYQTPLPAE